MRLIDADALKPYTWLPADKGSSWLVINAKDVDDAPTIDPVRHGHWIKRIISHRGSFELWNYQCDICHDLHDYNTPFCPSCGAKMDELFGNSE